MIQQSSEMRYYGCGYEYICMMWRSTFLTLLLWLGRASCNLASAFNIYAHDTLCTNPSSHTRMSWVLETFSRVPRNISNACVLEYLDLRRITRQQLIAYDRLLDPHSTSGTHTNTKYPGFVHSPFVRHCNLLVVVVSATDVGDG